MQKRKCLKYLPGHCQYSLSILIPVLEHRRGNNDIKCPALVQKMFLVYTQQVVQTLHIGVGTERMKE